MIKLHDYQIDGRNWILSHNNSGLFFPPGLGKTLVTLSAIDILIKAGAIDKVFIIDPIRVIHAVWPEEIKKWDFDLSIGVCHGSDKDKIIKQDHDIYAINPEGLKWFMNSHKSILEKKRFMLVCDESTLFKNHGSIRFKMLKSILKLFIRRIILTGTPAPNGLIQLWSQIYILDMGHRLGSGITKYRMRWFQRSFDGFGWDIREGSEYEIYKAIDDIVMHKSNDELNLPELVYNNIMIELPPEARKYYKEMKDTFVIELSEMDESIIAPTAAAKAAKLKQISNGMIYGDNKEHIKIHDEKLKACQELVSSLAGRPLMVVYEYLHDFKVLKETFKAPHIGGGISGQELSSIIARWNKGEIPILLVQPKATGHGLNLQDGGCHDVLHYSITFDLELYEQINARVHRQGVKNNVTIHHLVGEKTIDQRIMRVLTDKSSLQKELMSYLLK